MKKLRALILSLCLGLCSWGCESGEQDRAQETVEPGEGGAEEFDEEVSTEAPSADPFEGAHDGAVAIDTGAFEEALVEGICLAYENCRNQDFQVAIYSLFLQALAQEDESDEELARLMKDLEEKHRVPPGIDCNTLFGRVVEEFGMSEENLESKIAEGKIEFDAVSAGQCISRFGIPFDLCSEERVLSTRMQAQDFVTMMSRHERNMDEHFQVCGKVFTGHTEVGAECEANYECVGNHQCGEDDSGARVCMSAQAVSGGGFLP